ncbi:MAG: hypothetical protein ACE5G3_08635 [Gammaproteobacteria bacterium]
MNRCLPCICLGLLLAGPAEAQVCNALTATLTGSDFDDQIQGTPGDDIIFAGAGNDVVDGNGGNDVICGGAGDDLLSGGAGDDQLFGEAGNDSITGGADDDVMDGGAGVDACDGTIGIDAAAAECETAAGVDVEIIPVALFADDGTALAGALYRPFGDAGPGIGIRRLAVIVSHGAMGSFASSVPKIWGLYGAPRGFTVLALNRRDWGPDAGNGVVLFEDATLDIGPGLNLLAAIGFEDFFVAGHSQGTQNAAIYPSFAPDDRVAAVGLYGTVADGRSTARDLLFSACPFICYDDDVALAEQLVAAGQGDVVIGWDTIFGQQLFRSPNNFLSYWGPNTLSVVEREITRLQIPALMMLTAGDGFTPFFMSQRVLDAALAAGIDASFVTLPQPAGYNVGAQGGNAHGFVATERAMVAQTIAWLQPRVPVTEQAATGLQFPELQPGGNYGPVADAGIAARFPGLDAGAALDGTNSIDVDGAITGYQWQQLAGTPVGLDDPQSATPAFTAPATPQQLSFMLTVTDDGGAQASAEVIVTVTPRPGDANEDGVVDFWDLNEFFLNLNKPASGPDDPMDIDGNGVVNVLDLRRASFLCDEYGCGFSW